MELDTFKYKVLPLRSKLHHIAMKFMENEEDAEDVVQESFIKLWRLRDKLLAYDSVEALAVTIVKNTVVDVLRSRKYHGGEEQLSGVEFGYRTPGEWTEQQDAVQCIRTLIGKLPSLQQVTIRMKDIEGYEISEIAEITGTSVENVRVNLSRARKKIKEQFIQMNRRV
ncbi:MAG: RNA polymerase sigma factor [Bacteroides sp.]|nr:RNA polymerase sigma factor [Bacteroides sp.]